MAIASAKQAAAEARPEILHTRVPPWVLSPDCLAEIDNVLAFVASQTPSEELAAINKRLNVLPAPSQQIVNAEVKRVMGQLTDPKQCPNPHCRKTTVLQLAPTQVRSADEGMDLFVICPECNVVSKLT